MLFKFDTIEDITAVAQCLFDRQKEHPEIVDPLRRLSNIWGGSVWNSGGGCMVWSMQLEDKTLTPGTFKFMHVTADCLCIYEGQDFNALESLDIGEKEATFIYQF